MRNTWIAIAAVTLVAAALLFGTRKDPETAVGTAMVGETDQPVEAQEAAPDASVPLPVDGPGDHAEAGPTSGVNTRANRNRAGSTGITTSVANADKGIGGATRGK